VASVPLVNTEKGKRQCNATDSTLVFFDDPIQSDISVTQRGSATEIEIESSSLSLAYLVDQVYQTDKTPLGIDPAVSMEFVLDLFKKMGLRLIVIKKLGKLLGILTKKDLLRILEAPIISINASSVEDLFNPIPIVGDEDDAPTSTTTHRYKQLTLDEEMELLR
jgi:CBS domain-containing protein